MNKTERTPGELFEELVEVFRRLRDPKSGCPWDLEQTHESLTPYVIEEAYEVVDAIRRQPDKLCEELGDLLLQVVFHACIAQEADRFNINDIIKTLSEKLIKRHPHVFGSTKVADAGEVLTNWETQKRSEGAEHSRRSVVDGVPKCMPALLKAFRLGQKTAGVGFDWSDATDVKHKIREELEEFLAAQSGTAHSQEELGDLLFALTQYGRKLGFNAEEALTDSSEKFSRRIRAMEAIAGARNLRDYSAAELDTLWKEAKQITTSISLNKPLAD